MYSGDIDTLTGAHCFERQTITVSGICIGWFVAIPLTEVSSFKGFVSFVPGSKVILHPEINAKTHDNISILLFVFDTILNLVNILI